MVKISESILVYAPEMNETVARWGAYAIPRMWREKDGELVIRFNGEADSADLKTMFCLPNLYFVSRDNGETWVLDENGEEKYDISILTGIEPAVLTLSNGEKLFLKADKTCKPIKNLTSDKSIKHPCGEAMMHFYHYGDIPKECKGISLGKVDLNGNVTLTEIDFNFPEREVRANYKAAHKGEWVDVDEYISPAIWSSPYMSALNVLADGTLVALSIGQHPDVYDRYCSEIYLVQSLDNGKTWTKRATVASSTTKVPYGYGGDGGEVSLAVAEDGSMHCVMRMDMSMHPDLDDEKVWGTYFTSSFDGGYTWDVPKPISDSSVTPHIIALSNALLVIYGRPGVHCKVSYDKGETWSESYSIIGKTLEEERKDGRGDFESKYLNSCSYSNTFVEKISDNTVLVCYNNLKYPDKNGVNTKACFVKKITVE